MAARVYYTNWPVQVYTSLSEEVAAEVRAIAETEQIPVSAIIRKAVERDLAERRRQIARRAAARAAGSGAE